MLISSSLAELGKSLKSSSPRMETKGIASHRSAVTTLNHHLPPPSTPGAPATPLHHDDFVRAVTREFAQVYATAEKKMETREVSEGGVKDDKVWKGYEELKGWEWQYGQTPEFTNELEGSFSFGDISVALTSRHALIQSITFHLFPPLHASRDETAAQQDFLDALALSLVGKPYESLRGAEGVPSSRFDEEKWRDMGNEVMGWLRRVM